MACRGHSAGACFSSSFKCVPGLEWSASYTHTHTHTHTFIERRREWESEMEGEEREVRRLFVASLLTGCWFGREPPKVEFRESVCVYVCVCVFRAHCLGALFCQEVSSSSCVNSGLATSTAKNTGCLVCREKPRDHETCIYAFIYSTYTVYIER